MKRTILSLLILALPVIPLAVLNTGCATTEQNERLSVIAQIASRRGTALTLATHPEYTPAFEAAVVALDQLILQPEVDYVAISTALQKLKIDEIQGTEGQMLIADSLDIWEVTVGQYLRLNDESNIRPVAEALRDGIRSGIALSTQQ